MTVPGGLKDRLYGTIYGQCIGDAVGLLTEFMTGNKAAQIYPLPLEYYMKVQDEHRDNWAVGDWTADTDQMILIMQTLTSSGGKVDTSTTRDFAQRLQRWAAEGFPELGDKGGCGLGQTTQKVLKHPKFSQDPQHAAQQVWRDSGRAAAPRGAVMRTSILGTLNYRDLPTVVSNTRAFCLTTHADPRCVASCVAVATSIALMLQGWRDVPGIVQESFQQAQAQLPAEKDAMRQELLTYMQVRDLRTLLLDERGQIGYTYKALGAGFWALRQRSFRDTIIQIAMEGGAATSNCAVAGALLGCRLGMDKLRGPWLYGLRHKHWLDDHIQAYLQAVDLLPPWEGGARHHKEPSGEVDQWLRDIKQRERRKEDGEPEEQSHEAAAKPSGTDNTSTGRPQMIVGDPPEDRNDRNDFESYFSDMGMASNVRASTTEGERIPAEGDRMSSEKQTREWLQPVGMGGNSPDRKADPVTRTRASNEGGYKGWDRLRNRRLNGPRLGPLVEYVSRMHRNSPTSQRLENDERSSHMDSGQRGTSDFSQVRQPAQVQQTAKTLYSQERSDRYKKITENPDHTFDAKRSVPILPRRLSAPHYLPHSNPSDGDKDISSDPLRQTRHSLPSNLKVLVEQSEVGVSKLNTTRMDRREQRSELQRSSSLPSGHDTVDIRYSSLGETALFEPSYLEQAAARRRTRSEDFAAGHGSSVSPEQHGGTLPYRRSVSPERHRGTLPYSYSVSPERHGETLPYRRSVSPVLVESLPYRRSVSPERHGETLPYRHSVSPVLVESLPYRRPVSRERHRETLPYRRSSEQHGETQSYRHSVSPLGHRETLPYRRSISPEQHGGTLPYRRPVSPVRHVRFSTDR